MTREEAIRDIEECVLPHVGGISLRMAISDMKKIPAMEKEARTIADEAYEKGLADGRKEIEYMTTPNEGLVEILRRTADLLPEIVQNVIENLPELMEKNAWTEERAIDFLHDTGWMQRHDEEMTRPHGEWVYHDMNGQFCSVCEKPCLWKFNFCPSCGADMRPWTLDEAIDGKGKDGNVKEGEQK